MRRLPLLCLFAISCLSGWSQVFIGLQTDRRMEGSSNWSRTFKSDTKQDFSVHQSYGIAAKFQLPRFHFGIGASYFRKREIPVFEKSTTVLGSGGSSQYSMIFHKRVSLRDLDYCSIRAHGGINLKKNYPKFPKLVSTYSIGIEFQTNLLVRSLTYGHQTASIWEKNYGPYWNQNLVVTGSYHNNYFEAQQINYYILSTGLYLGKTLHLAHFFFDIRGSLDIMYMQRFKSYNFDRVFADRLLLQFSATAGYVIHWEILKKEHVKKIKQAVPSPSPRVIY